MNNTLDIKLLKKISLLGLIFGAIVGFFSVFPILTGLGLLSVMCFSSCIVLYYLVFFEKYEFNFDNLQSVIAGAVIGSASTVGFFVIYTPVIFIANLIFKAYRNTVITYIFKDALWLYALVIIVFAFIFACTNAVFAALTNIILEKIKKAYSNRISNTEQEESENNGQNN